VISERFFWPAALLVVIGSVGLIALESESWPTALLAVALFTLVSVWGHKLGTDIDREWIGGVIALGFATKMIGATSRYLVLAELYDFGGDATAYDRAGRIGAQFWRNLQVPPARGGGSAGTHFTERATALLYAPTEPTMLGGFLLFATVAFIGQVMFYLAFRRIAPARWLPWYAFGVFFLPSLLFWPSSIGKESLMMLFLGVSAYGAVRVLHDYAFRWAGMIVAGLAGVAAVRVHVAALFAVALAVPLIVGKKADVRFAWTRRFVLIGAAAGLVVMAAGGVSDVFGIDLRGDDLDPFLRDIERRTAQGGSAVEGGGILDGANPVTAAARVLFRPHPWEAHNLQAMVSAIESVLLLGVIAWNTPRMVRHLGRLRRYPYLLLATLFTGGFVVAFSAIFNLGILARQRTQALPFLLAALVGLSVRGNGRDSDADSEAESPRPVSSLYGR
jgi:hypothetical protein